MIKRNLGKLIVTSIVIVLPLLVGLLLWNQLPEQIPVHWNAVGEIDGYADKVWAICGMPLFVLVVHWLCTLATTADPKHRNIEGKPLTLVLWICPTLSVVVQSLVYATALGVPVSVEVVMPLVMGVGFVIIGNYLPKCRQSYTLGIKLPWTLSDEENWNRTHRFAGGLWVAGGLLIAATAFLGSFFLFFGILLLMVIVPTVYSYLLYRKKK